MRKGLIFGFAALAAIATVSSGARAAGEGPALPQMEWSFDGPFGTFDRPAMQRGLQVYREVCSACHSLKYVAFRNLSDLGYDEDEIKAIAAEYTVVDGPNDEGEMFEREGRPSDYFPSPFPNDKAAAASNGGAAPPDLSLMAKARMGGPTYLYALMTGYEEPPADFPGDNYNLYFPGHQIAMAAPLFEDGVSYADGTPATVEQMAKDVSHFLMWTAEPKLEDRKGMGIKVLIFLVVFTGVLYAAKRKVWADVH
ncbi:cytochrome c1 [Pelagibius sp. CAU 1746]|uniref:cytochrome c1 n=1 Tax=Pelagibius sp. CAU 1746 TaxID=3140370 RepID=UPI00325B8012